MQVINLSVLGYLDGSGGQDDIVATIRPAAFGIATFDFMFVEGTLQATNIEAIAGETPGRQTVPRAELFGAIVLTTRVHHNVCARLGIDAAYVTNGVLKRARLERGSNGDV